MPTFSVAAMVRETAGVLARFAAHYTELGAAQVRLFYDGTAEEADTAGRAALERDPRVVVTVCDAAFWEERGGRPDLIRDRQSRLSALALEQAEADWLLICDADEFVAAGMPMTDFLAALPAEGADSVVISPAESFWLEGEDYCTPFTASHFRRVCHNRLLWPLIALGTYGRRAPLFRRGVLGHAAGKQFLRRGSRFDLIRVHNAWRGGRAVSVWARRIDPALGAVELAHFDAVSLAGWDAKFARNAAEPNPAWMQGKTAARRRQFQAYAAAASRGPEALEALFRDLYVLSPRQHRLLARQGLVLQHQIGQP